MATDDDKAFWPEASQAAREMLAAVPLQGDFGRPDRRAIHFEPMIPKKAPKNMKKKVCGLAIPLGLTNAARGHNISMGRGVIFFPAKLRRIL